MDDVHVDGMSSHGYQAVSNSTFAIKDMFTARCGGSGVRSEAASVNLSIEDSVSSGNNFGYEATAGSVRIANCGMYYNNTNLSATVLSAGNNRSAGNSTTNMPTPERHDHQLTLTPAFDAITAPAPAKVGAGVFVSGKRTPESGREDYA